MIQLSNLLPQASQKFSHEAIITMLLLCLIELSDGNSIRWKWHLDATKLLITSPSATRYLEASPSLSSFAISLFDYVDSVATISSCRPSILVNPSISNSPTPLVEQESTHLPDVWLHNLGFNPNLELPFDERSVYGISRSLLRFFGKLGALAHRRKDRAEAASERYFRASAERILAELSEWRASEDRSAGNNGTKTEGQIADAAFEWAIRLRVHQMVEGYSLALPVVAEAVEQIVNLTYCIPYNSAVSSSLLFPLVMAGTSATHEEHQMIIDERLLIMEQTVGFRHVTEVRQLVRRVWKERTDRAENRRRRLVVPAINEDTTTYPGRMNEENDDEINWASIRHHEFPGIVFF